MAQCVARCRSDHDVAGSRPVRFFREFLFLGGVRWRSNHDVAGSRPVRFFRDFLFLGGDFCSFFL